MRLRDPRSALRDERGSASIEFAGSMLVFVLVLIFVLQAGAMMVTLPPGDPEAAAARAAPGIERQMEIQGGGDSVTVFVRLKTPLVFEAVESWNWWVHASATMRRER